MTNEAVEQAVLEKLNLLETGLNGVKSELGEVRERTIKMLTMNSELPYKIDPLK